MTQGHERLDSLFREADTPVTVA